MLAAIHTKAIKEMLDCRAFQTLAWKTSRRNYTPLQVNGFLYFQRGHIFTVSLYEAHNINRAHKSHGEKCQKKQYLTLDIKQQKEISTQI